MWLVGGTVGFHGGGGCRVCQSGQERVVLGLTGAGAGNDCCRCRYGGRDGLEGTCILNEVGSGRTRTEIAGG